jgi:hypothetical protein
MKEIRPKDTNFLGLPLPSWARGEEKAMHAAANKPRHYIIGSRGKL